MEKTKLNVNGQPLNKLYNRKRLNDRTIDEMLGLAKGIIADGKVNTLEAEFLFKWMSQNIEYTDDPVINLLFERIQEMLSDNILDKEEEQELLSLLQSVSGEQCPADRTQATAATFPLDDPPPVVAFPNAIFCLTGTFAYGPRKVCALATKERGGIVKNGVSMETDYLVIGTLCSSEWIHTSYGRKIEKAMEYRSNEPWKREGLPAIKIIHEDHWAGYAFTD